MTIIGMLKAPASIVLGRDNVPQLPFLLGVKETRELSMVLS